eukprot:gb/GEZN01016285.1/.p1 GENE.gb/GEZN01016285.1/~~gb/GEZN01016285.1/.p1  ORF type:complete len:139 (-),score=36.91 gb/GEZN01016285.1/:256-672(-)
MAALNFHASAEDNMSNKAESELLFELDKLQRKADEIFLDKWQQFFTTGYTMQQAIADQTELRQQIQVVRAKSEVFYGLPQLEDSQHQSKEQLLKSIQASYNAPCNLTRLEEASKLAWRIFHAQASKQQQLQPPQQQQP